MRLAKIANPWRKVYFNGMSTRRSIQRKAKFPALEDARRPGSALQERIERELNEIYMLYARPLDANIFDSIRLIWEPLESLIRLDETYKSFLQKINEYHFYGEAASAALDGEISDQKADSGDSDYFHYYFSETKRKIDNLYRVINSIILLKNIEDDRTAKKFEVADGDKFQALEDFAIRNQGVGVAHFARMLFSERYRGAPFSKLAELAERDARLIDSLQSEPHKKSAPQQLATAPDKPAGAECRPLPDAAPETYQGLRGPETPPAFVQRVYGPWLGHGLDRAHIRHLDPKLSAAIDNWMSRPGNDWPPEVDLPTRSEQNRRVVEQLRAQAPDGDINKVIGSFTMREAERLRSAAKRTK